jgi:hypothetical protein
MSAMKAPRKKKRPKKAKRPLQDVPLDKLLSDVEHDIRMKLEDSDKPKRDL